MKAWIGAGAALAALWSATALAQDGGADTAQDDRRFTSQDVFDLEYADDPRIAPDGRHVLYTRRSNNIMTDRTEGALWLAALDGSSNRLLLDGASGGEWSPDGTRIAYTGSDDDGRSAIFIRWMDTGQVQRVAALDEGAGNLSWSPDGEWIAFTSRVDGDTAPLAKAPPRPEGAKWSPPVKVIDHARYRSDGAGFIDVTFSHVFVVPAGGGTPRQLTSGEFNHSGPLEWTAGGDAILFSANRDEGWELQTVEGDIWQVSVADKSLRQVTSGSGLETSPQLSPDGRSVAFVCMPNVKRPGLAESMSACAISTAPAGATSPRTSTARSRISAGKDATSISPSMIAASARSAACHLRAARSKPWSRACRAPRWEGPIPAALSTFRSAARWRGRKARTIAPLISTRVPAGVTAS